MFKTCTKIVQWRWSNSHKSGIGFGLIHSPMYRLGELDLGPFTLQYIGLVYKTQNIKPQGPQPYQNLVLNKSSRETKPK